MRPIYPHNPIGSIESLSTVLGLTKDELISLANKSDDYFFVSKRIIKEDKSIRLTYDVKPELKQIHEKIKNSLLKKVNYPDYLQGGVKGKDYLSNCRIHTNKAVILKEDISNFFPSISQKIVHQVWAGFFNFPNDVAQLLTKLTTFNGFIVQGCKTSGYICNLVLWEREPKLASEFSKKGYRYSRLVDDITVSCSRPLSKKEQSQIISQIYAMLKSIGATPNKKKHKVMSNGVSQQLHRVNLNSNSPTLSKNVRANIKTAVFQCEQAYEKITDIIEYKKQFNSVMGRVNTLNRMHPRIGKTLKDRLMKVKP